MPRVMCIWFPNWPIQRLRSERPELRRRELVLFAAQSQRPTVIQCTPGAERQRRAGGSSAIRGQGAFAEGRLPPCR